MSVFGGPALNFIKPWFHELMFISINIINVGSVETVVKSLFFFYNESIRSYLFSRSLKTHTKRD